MLKTINRIGTAGLFALSVLAGLAFEPTVVLADDEDLYCFEYTIGGRTELECTSFGDLKAECKLTDPETTTDVCQDVNASRIARPTMLLGQ